MKRAPNARWTRIFGLAGLLTLLRRVRRRADAKELAIESREQLFSMLVRNADDIYVMFSPDAYEVEYVSPNVEKLLGVSVEAVKNNIRALSDSAADPSSDPRIDDIASLEEGECLQVFRERIQARTGERRWYQETLYRESIKGVDKYVLVLSDRTNEQKGSLMLEQALDIARSLAYHAGPVVQRLRVLPYLVVQAMQDADDQGAQAFRKQIRSASGKLRCAVLRVDRQRLVAWRRQPVHLLRFVLLRPDHGGRLDRASMRACGAALRHRCAATPRRLG